MHKWSCWHPDGFFFFSCILTGESSTILFPNYVTRLKDFFKDLSAYLPWLYLYLEMFAFVMATSNIEILRMVKCFKRKVSLWHPFKYIVSQGMYFEKGQMVAFPRTSVTHHSFTEQPRCCWQLVCKSCWQFVQCLSCRDWGCPGHTIYQI